jgi:hypothetical protein
MSRLFGAWSSHGFPPFWLVGGGADAEPEAVIAGLPAAIRAGTQPDGKSLGLSARQQLSGFVCNTYKALRDARKEAWNFIAKDPERIASIGTRHWARGF